MYFGHQPAIVLNTEFFELFEHFEVDEPQHFGIVDGTVVVEIAEPEILCNGIELMHLEVGVDIARQRNGVKVGAVKLYPLLLGDIADKTGIKPGVVRHEQIVAHKGKKLGQHLSHRRRVLHHVVGYGRKLGDLLGDVTFGIDKCRISVNDLAVSDLYGADLGYLAGNDRKTGGFDIKDHDLVGKCAVPFAEQRTCAVVDKIRLKPVYDLHLRLFGGDHRFGKALNVCVVGNGDRLVSPALCGIHRVGGRYQRIHRRHIRVQMQLDALFLGGVLTRQPLYFCDRAVIKQHIGRVLVGSHVSDGGDDHPV